MTPLTLSPPTLSNRRATARISVKEANGPLERPLWAGQIIVEPRRTTCLLPDREVTINVPGRLMADLARRCDGHATLPAILDAMRGTWDKKQLSRLIAGLARQGALCEARNLPRAWWQHVKNPGSAGGAPDRELAAALPTAAAKRLQTRVPKARYESVATTPFVELASRRASVRTYADRTVDARAILRLLWAAYGAAGQRTVPSAGGIYPLHVHLINLRPTGQLAPSVYSAHFLDGGEVGLRAIGHDVTSVYRAFLDPQPLSFAQGIVVLSGEFERTALKYENRSALYVPLEAGHAAQNVLLAAAEAELGAVEIGGFAEDTLARLLDVDPGVIPLTSIVFGAMPTGEDRACAERPPGVEFRWVDLAGQPYAPSYCIGAARQGEKGQDWSWGRSTDSRLAHTKAVAEAQERWSCLQPTGLVEAPFDEAPQAVDPRQILAYSPQQYAQPGFAYVPFDSAALYGWKQGNDVLADQPASVLADCVYYEAALRPTRPYTGATSSGMAAYTNQQGALERAVLELVERDAFMTTWLGWIPRPTIRPGSLPAALAARMRALRRAGVRAVLKDLSDALAPVVMAFAQAPDHGFTCVTAAADFDPEKAVDAALMELEFTVCARLADPGRTIIQPPTVETPQEHAELYAQRRYFRRADGLLRGGSTVGLAEVGCNAARRWSELVEAVRARYRKMIWIDMTPPGASLQQGRVPLTVGRAIVPGLIPINFGFGTEPLGSFAAWRDRAVRPGPMRLRFSVPLFPHPFA